MRARGLIVTPRAKRDIARIVAWCKEHLGARAAAKAAYDQGVPARDEDDHG
jgi:hypothetical protein